MNREIKFRAWTPSYGGVMRTPKQLVVVNGRVIGADIGLIDSDVVLMQYTGLKDKNGKEIYEGDIVRGFYPGLGQVKFGKHMTSTDFYASGAYGWYIEAPNNEEYSITIQDNTEVIGNIYENPHLLKHD